MFFFVTLAILIPFSTSPSTFSPITQPNYTHGNGRDKIREYQFHIAPMQCYTNLTLRTLFHFLSPSSVLWTEMEKVNDVFPENCHDSHSTLMNAWTRRLGKQNNDHSSLILQLGCNDPKRLKTCVEQTVIQYDTLKGINLNCGCPSIESGGAANYGASLMKDPFLTGRLVESMKEALSNTEQTDIELSVKCRIGVFDSVDDIRALTAERDYDYLHNYVSIMKDAGIDHVILHARPAILSGLNPTKNRIVPELKYDFVERIASEFPDLRVTLNGGISDKCHLKKLIETKTYVDSHMAGRWCLRRPLDLVGIEAMLRNKNNMEGDYALKAVEKYLDHAISIANNPSRSDTQISELCLPLFLISEQLKEDYALDSNTGLSFREIEDIHDILCHGISDIESLSKGRKKKSKLVQGDINFKRISTSLKSIVGSTKLANKWKRNRKEL
mmetsp:Transcript_2744/g.3650  ORF Transcript_2744/g.3650 Transcript_2744/m.3650 type:complete len:442 (+) Transcript_2744:241-1566(+)